MIAWTISSQKEQTVAKFLINRKKLDRQTDKQNNAVGMTDRQICLKKVGFKKI